MASASNICALLLASAIPDELIINVQSTKYHVLSILKLKVGFQNVLAENFNILQSTIGVRY